MRIRIRVTQAEQECGMEFPRRDIKLGHHCTGYKSLKNFMSGNVSAFKSLFSNSPLKFSKSLRDVILMFLPILCAITCECKQTELSVMNINDRIKLKNCQFALSKIYFKIKSITCLIRKPIWRYLLTTQKIIMSWA